MTRALEEDFSALHAAVRHHGILMLVSWGFLIPCSIACSFFLRRMDSDSLVFFRVHYLVAAVGMIIAIAGWIISCRQFDTMENGWSKAYAHGMLGTIVMVASIVIILMYPCMGKPINAYRSISQKIVAALHTFLGYGIVLLAWITCYIGTRITWIYDGPFLIGFLGCLAAFLLVALSLHYKSRIQQGTHEDQQQLLPK